jgi:hypothetical protein
MAGLATRWNVVVAPETDRELRQFLAAEGGGKKGDLSKFVEDAVKARIFHLSAARAKAANAGRSDAEIDAAVNEALEWARGRS